MDRLDRLDRSRGGYWTALLLIGFVMLGLNWMTPLLVDDYTYIHSWADWSIIKSPLQIPASMYAHGFKMNGRMISHAFEQLFLIPSKHVFDLCNAAVFVWMLVQSCRICLRPGRRSVLILLLCGMGFWLSTPVFGQVCLWQDGSVNYLWALAFALFCLKPFLHAYLSPEQAVWRSWWRRGLFLVAALLFGMYSETTTFAVIIMALALLIARRLAGGSLRTWLWLALTLMIAGYCVMVTMPAELKLKSGSLELVDMLGNLAMLCQTVAKRFLIPLLSWSVLMVLACLRRTDAKRRVLSLIFALGAAVGCGVLSAASYVEPRSLCTGALFLVIANVILVAELLPVEKALCLSLSGALCAAFALSFVMGVCDNFQTHDQWLKQKAAIDHALEMGERTVVVEQMKPTTEYCACYGLMKLNTADAGVWPNTSVANYYGLDSILGK